MVAFNNKKKKSSRNLFTYNPYDFPKDTDGVLYVRQSSLTQVEKFIHSYEMQTEKFVEHFRTIGCTGNIDIIADDEGMSGTLDIHERPGMSRLMKLIEEHKAGLNNLGWIAAVHVNRLFRDQWMINPDIFMKACYESGIVVATLRMTFDFRDAYCQRVFRMEAEESARHLEWMKLVLGGGKSVASSNGYYDGRWIVPGYIIDRTDPKRKKYIIYRPHADIVFWLFKRFFDLDGNFAKLCHEIESMPYVFPKFESWVDRITVNKFSQRKNQTAEGDYQLFRHGLASILTNRVYIGVWVSLDGDEIVENHEPLVPRDLFMYAYNRVSLYDLEGNRRKPQRVTRNGQVTALLKKVIKEPDGTPIYATADDNRYTCILQKGHIVHKDRFTASIKVIDEVFLGRFLQQILQLQLMDIGWIDKQEQQEKEKAEREAHIRNLIAEAQRRWTESMTTLKDPSIPKTTQMKIDLANECAGLEAKIVKLENDLLKGETEEEEDEKVQYQIYTLLPDLIDDWPELTLKTRLKFVGALVRHAYLSHPSPSWLKLEIVWKIASWGISVAHIKRQGNSDWWSDEEDTLLQQLWPTEDAATIYAALPERCWGAMKTRAHEKGIQRRRRERNSIDVNGLLYAFSQRDIEYAERNGIVISGKNVLWSLCWELRC